MEALLRWMTRPWAVLGILALLVLVLGHRAPFIRQDHSPERIFAADEEARAVYRDLVDTFSTDEVVLVQLRGASLDSGEDLASLSRLTAALSGAPGVRRVDAVTDLLGGAHRDPGERLEPEEIESLTTRVESLALFRSLGLVMPGIPALGAAVSIVMTGPEDRTRFNRRMREIAFDFDAMGYQTVVAGLTPANAAIDRETNRALTFFLPLVVLVVLIIGGVLFRSARVLAAMLLPPGGAVLVGVSGLALFGVPLDLATGVMPPLVLAIGFAGTIHLVSHYGALRARGLACTEAVPGIIRDKAAPTFFAFGTTALGFGSLSLSAVPSVRALGLSASGAMMASAFLVTLGTPAILAVLRPEIHSPRYRRGLVVSVARWALGHRMLVWAGLGLLVAFIAMGVTRVRTSIDGVKLLGENVPERAAFELIEEGGTGLANFEVWIDKSVPDEKTLLADAGRLHAVAAEVADIPLVTGTLGANDFLEVFQMQTAGRPGLPDGLAALELLEEPERQAFERRLEAFVHPERGLRLTVFSRTGDADQVGHQIERMKAAARARFPTGRIAITGHFVLLIGTPGVLMETLFHSLLLTVAVITVLLLAVFRSFRTVLGALVVNLLPVGVAAALMGWLSIPLDVATVMTASVVYGLAVDDTYHYLHHRRVTGSLLQGARIVGQGIVGTTLAVGGGFMVLALSGFNPVVRFGALTAFAMAVALAVDMVILPVLVADRNDLE